MAMNSSPARIERESIDTPATRAMGLSRVPGRVPKAPATCAIVHRISSSKDSSYPSTQRLVLFAKFLGLLLSRGPPFASPRGVRTPAAPSLLSTQTARCPTLIPPPALPSTFLTSHFL